jgi:hypothetical protein
MSDSGTLHSKARTFAKVPSRMIHDTRISAGAVRCYAHMHWRYGSNHQNWEGRRSVAEHLGISERTVSTWIRELEAHAWIVVVERDYNEKSGNYTTPYYHVFESPREAHLFRKTYQAKEGERVRSLPKPEERKSRKGVGGRPTHRVNSSSLGNSSSIGAGNSSSTDLDATHPEAITPRKKRAVKAVPLHSKQFLNEVYEAIATVWDTRANGKIVSMRSMFLGTAKKGLWKDCNFNPPVKDAQEILDFGAWVHITAPREGIKGFPKTAVTAAVTVQEWFYRFRRERATAAPVPVVIEQPASAIKFHDVNDFLRFDANGMYVGEGAE